MNDPAENQPFFMKKNNSFGTIKTNDDILHPESFRGLADPSAVETQYFGFNLPAERIHALAYMWHHPNLGVCSGGLFVFQGIKETMLHAELADWRTFMHEDLIKKGDLHEFRLDNGYGVKLIEPLQQLHMTYRDEGRGNLVDLRFNGVLPPVMFSDNCHFEQTMRVRGTLKLRGRHYDIDCYNVRDRSWGRPRPESLVPMAPMSWMTGVFGDDFSFNCTVYDQISGNPAIPASMALSDEAALNSGWVHADGQLGRIVRACKRVTRSHRPTVSEAIELRFEDEHGRTFEMRGNLLASCPFSPWNNIWSVINLMRWDCEGRIGHGDNQEVFWNDYLVATSAK